MAKKAAKKTRKPATAKAAALPNGSDIPEGFKQLGGGYAPTWKPDADGPAQLMGEVTGGVREVEMTIGRKKQTRRCLEVTDDESGSRFTIWESAALGEFFDQIAEQGEGAKVFVRYDGLGTAKKGQNPPKLFTVAIAE